MEDAVDGLAVQLHDLVVPVDLHELHGDAQRGGEGGGHVGVKADPVAGVVLVVHGLKIGDANHQRALGLDIGHVAVRGVGNNFRSGRNGRLSRGKCLRGGGLREGSGIGCAAGGHGKHHGGGHQKRNDFFHGNISPS